MQKNPLIARIGTFFIFVGIGVLIIFISSDLAQQPDFDYLFIAILLIGVGWLFQRKRPSPPTSGRFSILRGMRAGRHPEENKEEQENK